MNRRRTAALAIIAGATMGVAAPMSSAQATPDRSATGTKATATTAKASKSSDGGAQILARKSFKCKSPKGKTINLSWKPGSISTKVYFNNHCNQKRTIWTVYNNGVRDNFYCFKVNPHTKGNKKTPGKAKSVVANSTKKCTM